MVLSLVSMSRGNSYEMFQLFTSDPWRIEGGGNPTEDRTHLRLRHAWWTIEFDDLRYCCEKDWPFHDSLTVCCIP